MSFELAEEGFRVGGPAAVGFGLAVGALTYYLADRRLERPRGPDEKPGEGDGKALALGAFLDGVPEQFVLGAGLAAGGGVSAALLVAIFVSNLPESMGSASDMRTSGTPPAQIIRLFALVAAVCTLFTVIGYAVSDSLSGDAQGAVNGFAAGALLVMLSDSMIPEARQKGGRAAGLVTALGFAVAAGLSIA